MTQPPAAESTQNNYPLISEGVDDLAASLIEAGLDKHAFELEVMGYTIVPDVIPDSVVDALRSDLLRLAAMDEDEPVDVSGGRTHRDRTQEVMMLLSRGSDAMREAVVNTRTLPLIRYLLGRSCVLSSYTGYVKGPGRCELGIHSDTAFVPDPLPAYAQLANVNLLLSDYTTDAGCLVMVPGSHRYCHRPREGHGAREMVPIIAPAGSAVVFHGNTWHGALPRTSDGVRLTLSLLFSRIYMRTQEDYRDALTADQVAAMKPELKALVIPELPTGWRSTTEAAEVVMRRRTNGRALYQTRGTHA